MSGFNRQNADELCATLLDATVRCSERCLYQSAKWAAEMSSSLSKQADASGQEQDPDLSMDHITQPLPFSSTIASVNPDPEEARLELRETQKYLLAKTYFDCKEFERCAAVFFPSGLPQASAMNVDATTRFPMKAAKGKSKEPNVAVTGTTGFRTSPPSNDLPRLSQRSIFLALYAKYMSGEKRKDEDREMLLGAADRGLALNKELIGISRLLESWFSDGNRDRNGGGWLEYLLGVILAKGKNEDRAIRWLIRSVHLYPYNWGAWLELNDLIGSVEELHAIASELPQNIMSLIFHLHASQELYQSHELLHNELNQLENVFPDNLFLMTERALLHYHSKEFDEAEAIFSNILLADPYRIDSIDHYSNILYVMSLRPKLAFLAQIATATDNFRPETCCVVGNYFSLKSEHEKAVNYFRRALILDRNFLSAWTLMGHEYVEMKNTHAAIESYRRAVDVNRKDYRAWYGLGQTYEVLEMHLYALFYYQRASSLRPYDSKMWHAVASCYDKINRPVQSIKAYKRALVAGTYYDASSSFGSRTADQPPRNTIMDPEILFQIAILYEKLGEKETAADYMELTLAQEDGVRLGNDDGDDSNEEGRTAGTGVTGTTSKARIWLARWEFSRRNLDRAMELANELCQDGAEVEEAKALIRDVRARGDAEKSW